MIMICSECGQAVDVNIFGYGEINLECECCGGCIDPPNPENQGAKNDDENSFKGNRKKQNKKSLYQSCGNAGRCCGVSTIS